MVIKFEVKRTCGRDLYFPICGMARALVGLTLQRSLSDQQMRMLKAGGFKLEIYDFSKQEPEVKIFT
jgi:hypothetical protein